MNPFAAYASGFACLAILGICWLGWQLLRQNGRLLLRLEELEKRLDTLEFGEDDQPTGLAVGSEAPAFELMDLEGTPHSLARYRGQALVLLFFNPACGFCRELAPKLKEKVESRKQKAEMTGGSAEPLPLIISTGEIEANRSLFEEHKLDCPVLLQKETEVAAAYQANGTPSGYLIDAEGRIASELAMGGDALLELLEGKGESKKQKAETEPSPLSSNGGEREKARADRFSNRSLARSKIRRDGLKAGTPAPDFHLPRLDGGGDLSLSQLRGRRVLLVFSSPGCGPCNLVAPELEKFHHQNGAQAGSPAPGGEGRGEGEPPQPLQILMISKGEPKENRAKVKEHKLTFPVVLQQQWEISRRYAMFATPVAYLIDEKGVIAHDVAVGSDAILDLLGKANHSIEKPSKV
jgi:peroxiredoxin